MQIYPYPMGPWFQSDLNPNPNPGPTAIVSLARALAAPQPWLPSWAPAIVAHDPQAGALHCVRSLGPLIEVAADIYRTYLIEPYC